ncbi:MAG: hypothetical protein ACLQG3_10825, partial [Terracidiphilus sp.]
MQREAHPAPAILPFLGAIVVALRREVIEGNETDLKGEEIPRLCRGGSSSLTFPGVHPRSSRCEPTKAHIKENLDG